MNVTNDTLRHIADVKLLLNRIAQEIYMRSLHHDESKLRSPEKEMFEIWRPKLDAMNIESEEYKAALVEMGSALKHHYSENRHHPEHFENGLDGMNLIDLIAMVCDWKTGGG